jgi:glycosyltransferase involved in cell wall biosynthesis
MGFFAGSRLHILEAGADDFRAENHGLDPNPAGAALKNIVIVSGNRVAPAATGGQVRTVGIARALARIGHSVHIFSIAGRREDYGRGHRGQSTLQTVIEPGLVESTHLGLAFGLTQALARRLDYPRLWQHYLLSRGLVPKRLQQALQAADIVLSDLPYCPPVPGPWRVKPWFLISHNLEHKLLEQGTARQRRFADSMRRIESAAPHTYTDIFACAEEDREFFRAHDTGSRLQLPIVRCGVDPQLYAFSPDVRQQTRASLGIGAEDWLLVFSGSNYSPNVEACREIQEFCSTEAEFLARNRVWFLVVGSVCAQARRDGALIVTGRVPEVLPYLAAADAGLNLITRGSGSNVKLFEYLAARLPVISTVFGARGTELAAAADYVPCTRDNLKEVIRSFIGNDRVGLRSRAELVWNRHRHSCDIQELVNGAIAGLPQFGT